MNGRREDLPVDLRIDPSAWIAPGAVVVGEVTLGARASVWFNSVLRGDTAPIAIGADTNIQDNTTVHVDAGMPALVGARVTVGHRAIVHGCTIADDVLVGMGAVILSGARVGGGSLIGASALVTEGQVIPPGSLVLGAPAKVRGPVTDAHREAIADGARHYAALARAYVEKGFARPHPLPGDALGSTASSGVPMTWAGWGYLLVTLAEGPEWVEKRLARFHAERVRRRPAPDRWSAHELVGHLADGDADVYLARLEAVLAGHVPACADLDMTTDARVTAWNAAETAELVARWRTARGRLVARLAPLGRREWALAGVHALRGPFTLGAMVREWVEHDLAHRRQMVAALAEVA